ncbi:hypothetical protein PAXRUDRAFT_92311, partial [Paxillus rubicundulus Ve08.2h10]
AAIGLAKRTLNRYYSLMDSLELYCIAMGHKMEYFKKASWSAECTATALQLVCDTYNNSYTSCHIMPLKDGDVEVVGGNMEAKETSDNMFNNLPSLTKSKPKPPCDELNTYLTDDIMNVTNVLVWWTEHHEAYPLL